MNNLNEQISKYLEYCQYQKRLDEKTLKAYRIDLRQFTEQIPPTDIPNISQAILEDYIVYLHQNSKNCQKKNCIRKSSFSLSGI